MRLVRRFALSPLLALPACVAPVGDEPVAAEQKLPGVQAVYQIEEGDTLDAIAHRFAVPGGWRALAAANHLVHPDRIEAERGLIIPTEGLVAQGHDPFSLYDDVELLPRRAPTVLPTGPTAPSDDDRLEHARGADTRDTCGGRHQHLELEPGQVDDPALPHCIRVARSVLCVGPTSESEAAADETDGEGAVEVTVDGTPWLRLPYSFFEPLEVVEVDLDRDGRDELVLSDLVGVSNGAAIADYEMVVAAAPGAPAHRYTTTGWSLVDGGDACLLEHGSFEEIDDPVEGDGNYDVVRELVWRGGMLATRGAGIRAQRWSAQPLQLRTEPLLEAQVISRRGGTVVAFDDAPGSRRALTVALGGEQLTLTERSWSWSDDEDDPDPETQYAGLGWAGASVLLPEDYRPPAATLLGRDATIETRLSLPQGTLSQVVWLAPPT